MGWTDFNWLRCWFWDRAEWKEQAMFEYIPEVHLDCHDKRADPHFFKAAFRV